MSTASGDKTVNKVALCSAIFAGFAYVGYSVVRTAFCRKLGRRDCEGYENEHRLYFRRLSQTTQTDVLLGNLDTSGSGRIVLRPMTVQERIRDLNLRARLFTDTMLAVQSSGYVPHRGGKPGPRSLQCSPWSSPRILSPVDVRTFLASRSTENLSGMGAAEVGALRIAGGEAILVAGSPMHRRWVRRTQRQIRSPEPHREREEECREAETMLHNGEDELRKRLDTVGCQGRPLTGHEAKSLVALLHSNDEALLERTMITIGNCSTYSANQNMIREAGGLVRLQNLLQHPRQNIQLAAIKALSNLALNEDNQKEMKDCIPVLLSFVNRSELVTGQSGGGGGGGGRTPRHVNEATLLAALVALTNVAVLSTWHDEFVVGLHGLYRLLDTAGPAVRLQALRLLVNLSCNDDMAPSLLAAQAPKRILHQLDPSGPQDILLRLVTLLANLVNVARRQQIEAVDLPAEEKAASPDTMYSAIFGVHVRDKLACKASVLSSQHSDEDVRIQAGRLYDALKS